MANLYLIFIFFVAYLLGSFPSAYLITKKFAGKDVRNEGTGNVGAMNVSRVTGKGSLFWLTVVIDAGKGILAVLIPQWLVFLGYNLSLGIILAAFGVVLGAFIYTITISSDGFWFTNIQWWRLALGGFLVGFGTRLSRGCTSGHGISGAASLSTTSILAVITFIIVGTITAITFQILGVT